MSPMGAGEGGRERGEGREGWMERWGQREGERAAEGEKGGEGRHILYDPQPDRPKGNRISTSRPLSGPR
jgi:hypothetical protein